MSCMPLGRELAGSCQCPCAESVSHTAQRYHIYWVQHSPLYRISLGSFTGLTQFTPWDLALKAPSWLWTLPVVTSLGLHCSVFSKILGKLKECLRHTKREIGFCGFSEEDVLLCPTGVTVPMQSPSFEQLHLLFYPDKQYWLY